MASKMTVKEFGESVKAKYSQYSWVDSEVLGKKMLEKYPQYRDKVQVEKESIGNKVFRSAKNIVWGALETAKDIPKIAATFLQKPISSMGYDISKKQRAKDLAEPFLKKAKEMEGKKLFGTEIVAPEQTKLSDKTDALREYRKDVLQPTMWDKNSALFQWTKFAWDIWQLAAGSMALKWAAAWVPKITSAISKIAEIWKIGWKWLTAWKIGLWGLSWVWETAAYTALSEQRAPTKWELAWGAIIGGAAPVVSAALSKAPVLQTIKKWDEILDNPQAKDLWDNISPKYTTKEIQQKSAQGLEKQAGLLKETTYLPDKQEVELINTAKDIGLWKNRVKNISIVRNEIENEAKILEKAVKEKPFVMPWQEVAKRIDQIEKPELVVWDLEKPYENIKKKMLEFIRKRWFKWEWFLQWRKDFDLWVQKQFPDLYSNDKLTPLKSAIIDVRKTVNDILNEKMWSDIVKKSLNKQHNLMIIRDNMASRAWREGENVLKKALKSQTGKIVWTSILWAGWLKVADAILWD